MSNSIFGSPAFLLFKDTQNFQIGLLVVEDGPPKVCRLMGKKQVDGQVDGQFVKTPTKCIGPTPDNG